MKKSLYILFLVTIFVGCKPKQTVTNTNLDHKSQVAIKGDWTIVSVTYPGSEYFKITSFEIADSNCFVGSSWKFISNNNKGNMALTTTNCPAFLSPITWYINKDDNFVMKIINGIKPKKVLNGYLLTIANQTENSFQLIDKANVGGKMVEVVFQFQKN